jgi:hypothetical protein
MKWGFRKPSIRKRVAARLSWKRYVRNSLGLKAPRGWGWESFFGQHDTNEIHPSGRG